MYPVKKSRWSTSNSSSAPSPFTIATKSGVKRPCWDRKWTRKWLCNIRIGTRVVLPFKILCFIYSQNISTCRSTIANGRTCKQFAMMDQRNKLISPFYLSLFTISFFNNISAKHTRKFLQKVWKLGLLSSFYRNDNINYIYIKHQSIICLTFPVRQLKWRAHERRRGQRLASPRDASQHQQTASRNN